MAHKPEEGHFRRKYPRKNFYKGIGFLFNGEYSVFESSEMGEGGISFYSTRLFPVGEEAVVTFQIPGGNFISVRVEVRHTSTVVQSERFMVGCLFKNLKFENRREIRSYVSSEGNQSLQIKTLEN